MRWFSIATCCAVISVPAVCGAGHVTGISNTDGAGAGSAGPVSTPAPNNDNATTASPNAIPITWNYTAVSPLDVSFTLTAAGGTAEYAGTLTVTNNSGAAWQGFQLLLGNGSGSGAAFAPSPAGDGLDFDAPTFDPAPASPAFASLATGEDALAWSAGTVAAAGGAATFTFSIDVPDGVGNAFTLRAVPVVPEPSAGVVPSIFLIATLARRTPRSRHACKRAG